MKPKYIIFFIFIIFFLIIIYIFIKSGNNIISKDNQKIIEKILDMNEYEASANVTVYSNKSVNHYEIEFKEVFDNNYSLEIVKQNELELFRIELNNNKLKISNTKNNLHKVYEDYYSKSKNYLFLSNFIKDIERGNIKENGNEIIIEKYIGANNYLHKIKLYINKEKNEIEKLEIKDHEQNNKIIIKYIELKIQ